MLFPVKDQNPTRNLRFPFITVGLIGLCVVMFLWQQVLDAPGEHRAVYGLGAIPALITGQRQLAPDWELVPAWSTIFTSMFLHGGWLHLGGNMLFLWVFGDNVEDACGHLRFLVFYLLCGAAAMLVHVVSEPASVIPTIGASGAVSGVLGAYLVLHPRARIVLLVFFTLIAELPAVIVLSLWIAFQFFNALMQSGAGDTGGVAWWAHIGGFFIGALLIIPFRRRGVPLFDASPGRVRRHTLFPGRSVFPPSRDRRR